VNLFFRKGIFFVLCAVFIYAAIMLYFTLFPYPWSLKIHGTPKFEIVSTDNPITDEYVVTYTVKAIVATNSSKDDIKKVSEKIIERLPRHNMAIICFFGNESEAKTSVDFSVARTYWGPDHWDPATKSDVYPVAGVYVYNFMEIAMKGEALPGSRVEDY